MNPQPSRDHGQPTRSDDRKRPEVVSKDRDAGIYLLFRANDSSTLGSVFLMGFEGTAVTQHIRTLIEDYRLGAVLLNATNFVCKCFYTSPANS